MLFSGKKITIAFLLSFCLFHFAYGQDSIGANITTQKNLNLVLTKKSNSRRDTIKVGDRLKITNKNNEEIEGRVTHIELSGIHLKKEIILIENIYSIEKKHVFIRQLIGGVLGGIGLYYLFTESGFNGEESENDLVITGAILTAISIPLMIQKTYNRKRWDFTIE